MKFIFNAKINNKEAHGFLKIFDDIGTLLFQYPAISGRWGKGFLPAGEYIAKYYRDENGEAFSLFGIGFFVYLEPQFQTDRKELGIHFDGGNGMDGIKGYEGTLGCIGLQPKDKDEAILIKNKIRDCFEVNKEIPLSVFLEA